jgi:hypothetical protein
MAISIDVSKTNVGQPRNDSSTNARAIIASTFIDGTSHPAPSNTPAPALVGTITLGGTARFGVYQISYPRGFDGWSDPGGEVFWIGKNANVDNPGQLVYLARAGVGATYSDVIKTPAYAARLAELKRHVLTTVPVDLVLGFGSGSVGQPSTSGSSGGASASGAETPVSRNWGDKNRSLGEAMRLAAREDSTASANYDMLLSRAGVDRNTVSPSALNQAWQAALRETYGANASITQSNMNTVYANVLTSGEGPRREAFVNTLRQASGSPPQTAKTPIGGGVQVQTPMQPTVPVAPTTSSGGQAGSIKTPLGAFGGISVPTLTKTTLFEELGSSATSSPTSLLAQYPKTIEATLRSAVTTGGAIKVGQLFPEVAKKLAIPGLIVAGAVQGYNVTDAQVNAGLDLDDPDTWNSRAILSMPIVGDAFRTIWWLGEAITGEPHRDPATGSLLDNDSAAAAAIPGLFDIVGMAGAFKLKPKAKAPNGSEIAPTAISDDAAARIGRATHPDSNSALNNLRAKLESGASASDVNDALRAAQDAMMRGGRLDRSNPLLGEFQNLAARAQQRIANGGTTQRPTPPATNSSPLNDPVGGQPRPVTQPQTPTLNGNPNTLAPPVGSASGGAILPSLPASASGRQPSSEDLRLMLSEEKWTKETQDYLDNSRSTLSMLQQALKDSTPTNEKVTPGNEIPGYSDQMRETPIYDPVTGEKIGRFFIRFEQHGMPGYPDKTRHANIEVQELVKDIKKPLTNPDGSYVRDKNGEVQFGTKYRTPTNGNLHVVVDDQNNVIDVLVNKKGGVQSNPPASSPWPKTHGSANDPSVGNKTGSALGGAQQAKQDALSDLAKNIADEYARPNSGGMEDDVSLGDPSSLGGGQSESMYGGRNLRRGDPGYSDDLQRASRDSGFTESEIEAHMANNTSAKSPYDAANSMSKERGRSRTFAVNVEKAFDRESTAWGNSADELANKIISLDGRELSPGDAVRMIANPHFADVANRFESIPRKGALTDPLFKVNGKAYRHDELAKAVPALTNSIEQYIKSPGFALKNIAENALRNVVPNNRQNIDFLARTALGLALLASGDPKAMAQFQTGNPIKGGALRAALTTTTNAK